MPLTDLVVFAHLPGGFAPAGKIALTETDRAVEASSFAYGTRYIERPDAFEVDPVSLGWRIGEGNGKAVVRGVRLFPPPGLAQFGGIRDAAPDAWGRRVIEARRKVPANSLPESTYLLEAGSDRVGALDVRETLSTPAREGIAVVRSLQYMLEAVERIELGEPVPARLTDLFGSGPGAGGARPKASVRDDAGQLWLAKFPSISDTFDVARAEFATLTLARRCGMSVPELHVQDLGGKACLMIRRFDRYWADTGPLPADIVLHDSQPGPGRSEHRLPFVSGLTMVACDEMESRLKGYADLAQAVRARVHTSRIRADNRELFARMVFNILVSNDDDHLRNHGFVRDPRLQGWRLSPLYDVVPRPGIAHERYLHLQVGPQGKLATLDNAIAGCAAFSLDRGDALAVMAGVCAQVAQWRDVFEELGLRGALIERLAPAFRVLDQIAGDDLRLLLVRAAEAG